MRTGRSRVAVRTGRVRRRPSTACTSLLVMHRDPFDVGLSAVRESGGVARASPSNRIGGRPAVSDGIDTEYASMRIAHAPSASGPTQANRRRRRPARVRTPTRRCCLVAAV